MDVKQANRITDRDALGFINHHGEEYGTPGRAWRAGVDAEMAAQWLSGYDPITGDDHIPTDSEVAELQRRVRAVSFHRAFE